MSMFDTHVMVDWSASSKRSTRPEPNSIWWAVRTWFKPDTLKARLAEIRGNAPEGSVTSCDTGGQVHEAIRAEAIDHIHEFLSQEIRANRRVLVGFDFAFGYPCGFAKLITDDDEGSAVRLWNNLHRRVMTTPSNERDRYEVAKELNDIIVNSGPSVSAGPFWSVSKVAALGRSGTGNPYKKNKDGEKTWPFDFEQKRVTDSLASGAQTVWQLNGPGAVGSQVLLGVPWLLHLRNRLRRDLPRDRCVVWPFDTQFSLTPMDKGPRVVIVEIYPSLLGEALEKYRRPDEIRDCAQVRLNALAFSQLDENGKLGSLFFGPRASEPDVCEDWIETIQKEEGWIFGVDGHQFQLLCALSKYYEKEVTKEV